MTDETKKIDELEGKLQELGYDDAGNYDVPADTSDGFVAEHDGKTGEMPAVEDDMVTAGPSEPEPKRSRKGVIAGVAAAVIVLAIGAGVAVANQPATSGIEGDASSSTAVSSVTSATAKSSSSAAASSSSAAASASSASASATSAGATASGEAAKAENGQGSTSGNSAQAQQDATQASGAAGGNTTGSTSGGTSGGNASSGNGGGNGGGTATAQPAHTHNWVPITETRIVVDQEAWDEPIYETVSHYDCSICGDVGNVNGGEHMETVHWPKGERSSGGYFPVREQVGVNHHEAVTHEETVTVGYRCDGCGATK